MLRDLQERKTSLAGEFQTPIWVRWLWSHYHPATTAASPRESPHLFFKSWLLKKQPTIHTRNCTHTARGYSEAANHTWSGTESDTALAAVNNKPQHRYCLCYLETQHVTETKQKFQFSYVSELWSSHFSASWFKSKKWGSSSTSRYFFPLTLLIKDDQNLLLCNSLLNKEALS